MASLDWVSLNLLVAAMLGTFGTILLAFGRRRPEAVVLSVFLFLVGVNFLATALSQDAGWATIAYVALALDPLYLLMFVTMYPYERRPAHVRALLVGVGATAFFLAAFTAIRPDLVVLPFAGGVRGWDTPFHLLIILNMAVAYVSAWILSIRAAVAAPTPLLAQRAAWLVMAVGATVVPRLAMLHMDLRVDGEAEFPWRFLVDPDAYPTLFALHRWVLVPAVFSALVLGLGLVAAGGRRTTEALARPLRLVALITGGIFLATFTAYELDRLGGPTFAAAVPWAMRWGIFSLILVDGILVYEVVEFRRSSDRFLAAASAILGGLAVLFVAYGWLSRAFGDSTNALFLASAIGVASTVPLGHGGRRALRAWRRGQEDPARGRRLEAYRGILERHWAHGPPSAKTRRGLERERRDLGVSVEEAHTLEHVVAMGLQSPPRPLEPGDEPLPGVVVESLLGEGAHGRVVSARRVPSGDRLVIKELHGQPGTADMRKRLVGEARALLRFDHPRVVRLLDVYAPGDRYLILLEHVDGRPLSELVRNGPLEPSRVARLLADVLDALAAAHAHGIVHRDVKPSNILVDREGRARLTDFGIALLRDGAGPRSAPDPERTASSFVMIESMEGTLQYMAPEQITSQQAGPRSDLYSVGLVVYEALVGRPAIELKGYSSFDAIERVARPRVDLDAAPADWRAFLSKALDTDPSLRFPSAAAMLDALPHSAQAVPPD